MISLAHGIYFVTGLVRRFFETPQPNQSKRVTIKPKILGLWICIDVQGLNLKLNHIQKYICTNTKPQFPFYVACSSPFEDSLLGVISLYSVYTLSSLQVTIYNLYIPSCYCMVQSLDPLLTSPILASVRASGLGFMVRFGVLDSGLRVWGFVPRGYGWGC